jgi:hypothetical protein
MPDHDPEEDTVRAKAQRQNDRQNNALQPSRSGSRFARVRHRRLGRRTIAGAATCFEIGRYLQGRDRSEPREVGPCEHWVDEREFRTDRFQRRNDFAVARALPV